MGLTGKVLYSESLELLCRLSSPVRVWHWPFLFFKERPILSASAGRDWPRHTNPSGHEPSNTPLDFRTDRTQDTEACDKDEWLTCTLRRDYRQFSIIIRLLDCSSICGKSIHLPSLETGIAPIQPLAGFSNS